MQAFFENGQMLFPAKHLQSRPEIWQALEEELLLFPSAEHDDLFDGLETMMKEAMNPEADFGFVFIDVDPMPYGPEPLGERGAAAGLGECVATDGVVRGRRRRASRTTLAIVLRRQCEMR